jgi:hypothetical protein
MLVESNHISGQGVSRYARGDVRPQYETSEKVTATIVGGRAGVRRCRGFCRRRQDARSTANTAVILVLETGRGWRYA